MAGCLHFGSVRQVPGVSGTSRGLPDRIRPWAALQHTVQVAQVTAVAASEVAAVMAGGDSAVAATELPSGPDYLPQAYSRPLAASIGLLAGTTELIASDDWLIGIRPQGQLHSLELIRRGGVRGRRLRLDAPRGLERRRHRGGQRGRPAGRPRSRPSAADRPLGSAGGGRGPGHLYGHRLRPTHHPWGRSGEPVT